MLDQRRVDFFAFEKLHQPGLAVDGDQRLGPRAAQRRAGPDQPPLQFGHGLVRQDFSHDIGHFLQSVKTGHRPAAPWRINIGAQADTQRAVALIAREQQEFKNRQPGRRLEPANHPLAPAVGAGIVYGTRRAVFFTWQEQIASERQVFAQGKAGAQPLGRVAQGHGTAPGRQAQFTDRTGLRMVAQLPEEQAVLGDVVVSHFLKPSCQPIPRPAAPGGNAAPPS